LARFGVAIYRVVSEPRLQRLHFPGLLARLHLLDRITLTPEGVSFREQRRLTRALLSAGHRIFSLTYHSPSLAPGNTPYVRTQLDRHNFLLQVEQYLDFFINEVGGEAATPLEIKDLASALRTTTMRARPRQSE
jgi:hypothetical protein